MLKVASTWKQPSGYEKTSEEDAVPCIMESDGTPAACRKSWARLIQKIYEVDPLPETITAELKAQPKAINVR